jgi:hypothetical protein
MRLPTLDELEGNTGEVDAFDLEEMAALEAERIENERVS